jgi:hypothetical protein
LWLWMCGHRTCTPFRCWPVPTGTQVYVEGQWKNVDWVELPWQHQASWWLCFWPRDFCKELGTHQAYQACSSRWSLAHSTGIFHSDLVTWNKKACRITLLTTLPPLLSLYQNRHMTATHVPSNKRPPTPTLLGSPHKGWTPCLCPILLLLSPLSPQW